MAIIFQEDINNCLDHDVVNEIGDIEVLARMFLCHALCESDKTMYAKAYHTILADAGKDLTKKENEELLVVRDELVSKTLEFLDMGKLTVPRLTVVN